MGRPAGPPANDAPSIGIDDEGEIDEPRPGRDAGEVRHPQHVRRWRGELAVDVIKRAGASLSLIVVRTGLPRITPAKPISRISRATVQRAIGKPSRIICRQILRTPQTAKFSANTRATSGLRAISCRVRTDRRADSVAARYAHDRCMGRSAGRGRSARPHRHRGASGKQPPRLFSDLRHRR